MDNAWRRGIKVAIIGSDSLVPDIMIRVMRRFNALAISVPTGADPASNGLALSARILVPKSPRGSIVWGGYAAPLLAETLGDLA